jgi:carboxylesterase
MAIKNSDQNSSRTAGILFLHGFTSTPFIFEDISQELAKLGYATACPLIAGHGTTPEDLEKTSWKDWYISVHEAYNQLASQVDDVFVIGASFGSALACLLASEEHIAGLVLIGHPRRIYRQAGLAIIVWVTMFFGKRFYKKSKKYVEDESSIFGGSKQSYHKIPLQSVKELFHLTGTVCDHILPKIETPTMIIHSDKDGLVKPKSAIYLFKHLGSDEKQLIWVHEPHHRLHLGKSREQIYTWIKNFLSTYSTP